MTTQPTLGDLLHQEHLDTLAVINALEGRLSGGRAKTPMTAADPGDEALLRRLADMIANDSSRHFVFEEESLFPVLDLLGFGQITAMLRGEHEVIRGLGQELRDLTERGLRSSFHPEGWTSFRELAADLIHIETFHIQKEEMGIISRLPLLVDAETGARLAERYLVQQR